VPMQAPHKSHIPYFSIGFFKRCAKIREALNYKNVSFLSKKYAHDSLIFRLSAD
jgi:hypothetical protein